MLTLGVRRPPHAEELRVVILAELPRLGDARPSLHQVQPIVEDAEGLPERPGVYAVGGVVTRVDLPAQHQRRGLAGKEGHEGRGRDAALALAVAAEPSRAAEEVTQAIARAPAHLQEADVVGRSARDEGVVLDAVEVRAFLEEQVELLVAG